MSIPTIPVFWFYFKLLHVQRSSITSSLASPVSLALASSKAFLDPTTAVVARCEGEGRQGGREGGEGE